MAGREDGRYWKHNNDGVYSVNYWFKTNKETERKLQEDEGNRQESSDSRINHKLEEPLETEYQAQTKTLYFEMFRSSCNAESCRRIEKGDPWCKNYGEEAETLTYIFFLAQDPKLYRT
ncbi:hypothetical protein ACH5RR_032087 [Cinchona calisaya]|uniref:Uncharacterized protein n=1 Tax=Cinchona calisaya TaxID=153742 RepID=A0ABD2YH42_9GENT